MLHMILGILRILGYLILFLIILLFVLILAVLFIPIRYHVEGSMKEKLSAKARVSWLLRLFSFGIEIRGKELKWSVRILGYPFLKNEGEPMDDGVKNEENTIKDRTEQEEQPKEKQAAQAVPPTVVREETESVHPDDPKPQVLEEEDNPKQQVPEEDSVKEKRFPVFERLNSLRETISDLCRKKDRLMNFWNRTSTKKAVEHGKRELFYLLRHIVPGNLRGTIRFGLEDPAMTGQIFGILSILQAFSGNHLEAEADFNHKVLEGTAVVDGHIRVCHFLGVCIRMLLDKHVRITVKGIRTLQL